MARVPASSFKPPRTPAEAAPVYLIAGDESYLHGTILAGIRDAVGADTLNTETLTVPESGPSEIILAAQTMPFLSDRRLIIVREANAFKPEAAAALAAFLKNPIPTACIVLIWNEAVKKNQAHPLFSLAERAGMFIEARQLYDNEVPRWIAAEIKRRGKTITPDAVEALARESSTQMADLAGEIDKLMLFIGTRAAVTQDDVITMSGHTWQANAFKLADAIESRDTGTALRICTTLLDEGERSFIVLGAIRRAALRAASARSMLDEKKASPQDTCREARIHPFFMNQFLARIKGFSLIRSERVLDQILRADVALKTGGLTERQALEMLVVSLCA